MICWEYQIDIRCSIYSIRKFSNPKEEEKEKEKEREKEIEG